MISGMIQEINKKGGGGERNQGAGSKRLHRGPSRLISIISLSILIAFAYFASPIYCR
jgi:hypothetical protein